MTRVVNIKREKADVYIGRGSKWGNPYVISPPERTRAHVVAYYEIYIRTKPELMAALVELKGKTLGCYCAPLLCHGDVLIKLLKEMDDERPLLDV